MASSQWDYDPITPAPPRSARGLPVWVLEYSRIGLPSRSQADAPFSTLEKAQECANCINGEPMTWDTFGHWSTAKGRDKFYRIREWDVL